MCLYFLRLINQSNIYIFRLRLPGAMRICWKTYLLNAPQVISPQAKPYTSGSPPPSPSPLTSALSTTRGSLWTQCGRCLQLRYVYSWLPVLHIDRHAPQRMSPLRENNLPPLAVHPPPRHLISRFQVVAPGILGTGHWGRQGLYTVCHERRSTELPHPVINDQTLILVNFESLFLLSVGDKTRTL